MLSNAQNFWHERTHRNFLGNEGKKEKLSMVGWLFNFAYRFEDLSGMLPKRTESYLQ